MDGVFVVWNVQFRWLIWGWLDASMYVETNDNVHEPSISASCAHVKSTSSFDHLEKIGRRVGIKLFPSLLESSSLQLHCICNVTKSSPLMTCLISPCRSATQNKLLVDICVLPAFSSRIQSHVHVFSRLLASTPCDSKEPGYNHMCPSLAFFQRTACTPSMSFLSPPRPATQNGFQALDVPSLSSLLKLDWRHAYVLFLAFALYDLKVVSGTTMAPSVFLSCLPKTVEADHAVFLPSRPAT